MLSCLSRRESIWAQTLHMWVEVWSRCNSRSNVKIATWWSEGLIMETDTGAHQKAHANKSKRQWRAKHTKHHTAILSSCSIFNNLEKSHLSSLAFPPAFCLPSLSSLNFIFQGSSSVLCSLTLSPTLVMLLSAQLGSVTDRCQFKSQGLSSRARAHMWLNVCVCVPYCQVQYQNRKLREMVSVIRNL